MEVSIFNIDGSVLAQPFSFLLVIAALVSLLMAVDRVLISLVLAS